MTPTSGESPTVELFGGPRVRLGRDGHARLSPLQLALVALVYGHADGIRRGRAASLLWELDGSTDVRHRLRQLLVEIRSRCGRLIVAEGNDLRAAPGVQCDLSEFEGALERGSLIEAAGLATRGFAELPLPGVTDAYADWRSSVGSSALRRVKGRATAQWSRASSKSDWTAAREAAEALYVLDPLDPRVVGTLIEARGRNGDVDLAEAAYAAFMEASPHDRSSFVHDAIRLVRRARSTPVEGEQFSQSVQFVGRRDALVTARKLLDVVEAGRFGMTLIAGESGIGKTRLLQEALSEARFRDFRCLTAQAVELESRIPLNPLLDALSGVDLGPHLSALGSPWSAVIGAVLPPGTLAQPAGELPPIQERALPRRLLDALSLLLQRIAGEHRTILFIDDLHWADVTTITALQFMQRRWPGGPLGVMATIRTDLVRREEPVAEYLSQADGLITSRIELQELPLVEGVELVRQVAKERVDDETCRRICALAGLHPLCLMELTRDYLNGRLRFTDPAPAEMDIPISLEQLVGARLAQLDPRQRRIAGFLAVGARPMRMQTLAALAGMSVDDAADAVEGLRRARLVESDHDRVRIVHELFRSAIYRDLGEPRRSLHHKAVAQRVQAEEGDESVSELAIHYDRAGECDLAAKYGWIAADRAMETGTVAEAGQLYQLVSKNERDGARRAEAAAGHARALCLARDMVRANPALERAALQLRAVGRGGEALRLEIKRVEGQAEEGTLPLSMLTDALADLKRQASERSDWEALAQALDVELHLLHRAGDVAGILGVFGEMRDVAAKGSLEATILANAGLALGVLYGDPSEALACAERAVALSVDSREYRLMTLMRMIVVLLYQGRQFTERATPIVAEAWALASRSGDVLQRFSIESNVAVGHLDAGDLEGAESRMVRAFGTPGGAKMDLNRTIDANNRAELALARGEFAAAARSFAEAGSYLGPKMPTYLRELVAAGLGLCALETGDLAEARRREQELSELPGTWYFDPTTILTFRVRLLDRRGQYQEALDLLTVSAAALQDRLVLAWLKVRSLQVRLLIKRRLPGARSLALEALDKSEDLCLTHRATEFRALLLRLEQQP